MGAQMPGIQGIGDSGYLETMFSLADYESPASCGMQKETSLLNI